MDVTPVSELLKSIHATPIATLVTDARRHDNPIIAANRAFEQLTGYRQEDVIGRNCRFLVGPETCGSASAALGAAVRSGSPALVELINYRRDGSPFLNAVMIAPLLDEDGSVAYFIGSQMDVGANGGADKLAARAKMARLTGQQGRVLRQMVAGLRNKQIAAVLGINEKTVKMHRAALLERLGVATSAEAIRIAVEAGV